MKPNAFRYRLNHSSRRAFLGQGACAGLGVASLVNMIAQLQLMQTAASAATGPDVVGDDYKALICVFLSGGMDANNFIIPVGTHPLATHYQDVRRQVAVAESAINNAGTIINPQGGIAGGEQYGLHPSCGNLATLFEAGELAMICNIGTLAQPVTKDTYNTTPLPNQLFSHANQVQEWMSSVADGTFTSGWAGRVAQYLNADQNPDSNVSMLVTAAGLNDFMVSEGGSVPQYAVTTSGAVSLAGFGTAYANALNTDGTYQDNAQGRRLKALESIINYSHDHLLEEGYSDVVRRARINEALVGDALTTATNSGVNFDGIFNNPENGLAAELKVISQMIAGRKCLGNKRQIFFCNLGGWDTHQNINQTLPNLLGQVDEAVGQFVQAMKALEGADTDFGYEDVMLFQASDFNRTFTPNGAPGDVGAGTDHAWGTHAFVVGGAVEGRHFYGEYPDLRIGDGGSDDTPNSQRGRWIPKVSVDQYAAVLADWLGVDRANDLPLVLPNLGRFADPFDPANNLNFIDPLA